MPTPDSPQANGLLAWFRLGDASGDLFDSSYRFYPAVAQGNIDYHEAGIATLGNGFGVEPTSAGPIGLLEDTFDSYWNFYLTTISVQAWFKADAATPFSSMWGTIHAFIYKSTNVGDTSGWFFGVLPGGGNTVSFRVIDTASTPYTASYTETDFTTFHHYVGTCDDNLVKLYRDGVLVASAVISGAASHDATIGAVLGEGLQGVLQDVAVWNRAITAGEVTQLYNTGAGFNIVQVNTPTNEPVGPYPKQDVIGVNLPGGMVDGLSDPVDTIFPDLPLDVVPFSGSNNVMSNDPSTEGPTATDISNLPVYENVLQSPLPIVVSITADSGHVATFTGKAGPTNIPFVELFWEVALNTGYLTIPVSVDWTEFSLTTQQEFTTSFQIPPCVSLLGAPARFSALAPGPGGENQARRYSSAWVTLTDTNFENACSGNPTPPPDPYPGATSPLPDPVPNLSFDFYDITAVTLAQETIYAPAPTISVTAAVTNASQAAQVIAKNLPAGLYQFAYNSGALFDGVNSLWNYYGGTVFGGHLGGLWFQSGDDQPYYVIPEPYFRPAGYVSSAAAAAAMAGYKFIFLHTGGDLIMLTDYPVSGANSGALNFTITNYAAPYFGNGEWIIADTTMAPLPEIGDPLAFAPEVSGLSHGSLRLRYILDSGDRKQRFQDFLLRVYRREDSTIEQGFPAIPPQQAPPGNSGWAGGIRRRY